MKMRALLRTALVILLCALMPLQTTAEAVKYGSLTVEDDVTYVDMGKIRVLDWKAFYAFLDRLPNLEKVDMFATRIGAKKIEELVSRYPDIEFGWTIGIAEHSVRTDQTAFSTQHRMNTEDLHDASDFAVLKYCKKLRALDFGHNSVISLKFLEDLPDLKVLIIACNYVKDITPIAKLEKLEYLEIFWNRIEDLSPLTGLTRLMDLNIGNNSITDLTPLYQMPWLKRLWVYNSDRTWGKEMQEKALQLQAALPDTHVDIVSTSTAGGWRQDPHYYVVKEMFEKGRYIPFEDSWPDEEELPETAEK